MTVELPRESPVPVVDPFVVLSLGTETIEVPMPREALRDEQSLATWPSNDLVDHLFTKDDATRRRYGDATDLERFVANLDEWSIDQAGVPLASDTPDEVFDRLSELDGRVFVSLRANPHEGMRGVRRLESLCDRYPIIRSVSLTPFQIYPFMAPNSKEYFPIYAKCVEMERAVFVNVGFPGPRVPAWTQDPIHLDEVCWFFPELTVIMRHGGLPWVDTCVQMLLRWPNLYYATTAFAPRYYPKPIIELLNSRGTEKIVFAGYWPLLSYERIFGELAELPIRERAWAPFLGDNARRAFGLEALSRTAPTHA